MTQVTGFVSEIKVKPTSFGNMHDLIVNGTSYGAGKFPPKHVAAGDYISFEAEQKGKYWNVKSGSVSKLDKPAGVSPAAAPSRAAGGGYNDDRQKVISKQAALNTSIAFVKILAETGSLPMPAKVAQDKKADLLESIVLEYASKFHHLSTGEALEIPDTSAMDLASVEEAGNWSE